MIEPEPESDMSLNLLVVASDVIRILKKSNEYMFIDTILEKFIKADPRRKNDLFFYSLVFLYSVGAISLQGYTVKVKKIDST